VVNIKQFYQNTATLLKPSIISDHVKWTACNVSSIGRTSLPPNENNQRGGTLKVECAGRLSLRGWSQPRGKEWSTPAATTVGHSHPLLPDSALLSSLLTAAVASVFSMLIFKTISRIRTRLIVGLLRPWTATWERYWNLAMLWDRPHVRTHRMSLKAFDSVRHASIAVDRGGRREIECYLNLLMLDFWYRTRPPRSNAAEGYGQRSNAVYRWWHLNACERVSENAALILDCWLLHMAERFVAVYRIVSRYFVHYRIVSIVFPHGHIVPSLRSSLRMTPINHEKFHGNRSARFSEIRNTDRQSRQFYIYIYRCVSAVTH